MLVVIVSMLIVLLSFLLLHSTMSRTYRRYKGKIYPDKDGKNRKPARSCLNHGGCPYCLSSKMHKHDKKYVDIDEELSNMMDNRPCVEPESVSEYLNSLDC